MNRQIKFRAWDAEQNKMIETFDGEYQIHVNEEDGTVYCGGHMPNGDWNEPPLMQFTGKYDDLRNEIFEGDLLNIGDNSFVKNGCGKNAIYEVQTDGCDFILYRHDTKLKWGRLSRLNELNWKCKIIGNVYENHDVLSA